VQRVGRVKDNGGRGALGSGPERLASGSHLVHREVVQELGDAVVEAFLKLEPRPGHAVREGCGASIHQHAFHLSKEEIDGEHRNIGKKGG